MLDNLTETLKNTFKEALFGPEQKDGSEIQLEIVSARLDGVFKQLLEVNYGREGLKDLAHRTSMFEMKFGFLQKDFQKFTYNLLDDTRILRDSLGNIEKHFTGTNTSDIARKFEEKLSALKFRLQEKYKVQPKEASTDKVSEEEKKPQPTVDTEEQKEKKLETEAAEKKNEEQNEILEKSNGLLNKISESMKKSLQKLLEIDKNTEISKTSKSSSVSGGGDKTDTEKMLGGVGKGLSALGKGIANLGKGLGKAIGQFFEEIFTGIAKGLRELSDAKLFIGAGVLIAIGAALVITAFGLKMFEDISWESILKGIVVIGILVIAAMALGELMQSGYGAAAIFLGALAIAALGASLIPLAFAANLAAPFLEQINNILGKLVELDVMKLYLIGPALMGLAMGIAALTVSGILSSFVTKLSGLLGLDGPIEILEKIANLAPALSQAAESLALLNTELAKLNKIDIKTMLLLGPALAGIGLGLVALSAGSLMSSFIDGIGKLFGADGPIEKLQKISDTAPGINLVSESLTNINDQLERLNEASSSLNIDGLRELGPALGEVGSGYAKMVASMTISDLIGKLFGDESPIDKLKRLSDSGPNLQTLADALQELDFSKLNLQNVDMSELDLLIEKMKELGDAMSNVQLASITTSASRNIDSSFDNISEYANMSSAEPSENVESEEGPAPESAIPVRIVEGSDIPNKTSTILKEKTIEEKLTPPLLAAPEASQNVLNTVTSINGGGQTSPSSITETSANFEPLLISAVKGDLSLM